MARFLLLVLVLLSACKHGGGSSNDTPPDDAANDPDPVFYPFDFDQETPNGIMLETRGNPFPPASLVEIDDWYAEAHQCVADWFVTNSMPFEAVDGPPVIIEDDLATLCDTITNLGVYCVNYAIPFVGIQTNSANIVNKNVWKHEFIHHILVTNDIAPSSPMNIGHQPDELWDCEWN